MTPPTGPAGTTGPPDRQSVRLLQKHLAADPLVTDTLFEPNPQEPRLLRARLAIDRYPSIVDSARLDIRWFESGDFSVHYVETRNDERRWECRWDRHPNHHNTRLHVHRPPDGADVEDLSLSSLHPLDVYSTVLDAIEGHIERLWSE